MNSAVRDKYSHCDLSAATGAGTTASAARLQAIHDLIRSGDYHVPAVAIADRMVERMMAEKRGSKH
jgi:anti-sigma28 factor (negative regulator of flagellin synthesis)